MRDVGCRPTRERVPAEDGKVRQIRGYFTADIRTAVEAARTGQRALGQPEGDADDQ